MKTAIIAAAAMCIAASGAQGKPRRVHSEIGSAGTVVARAAVGDVNGGWRIEAVTTVGRCPDLIPTSLDIAEGKVTGAPSLAGEAWGYVDGEGQIVARFTSSGGHIARFHGNLRGGHGSGAWSSSTDFCGGTWRATRGELDSAER